VEHYISQLVDVRIAVVGQYLLDGSSAKKNNVKIIAVYCFLRRVFALIAVLIRNEFKRFRVTSDYSGLESGTDWFHQSSTFSLQAFNH